MNAITNKTRQYLIFYSICIFGAMPFYQGGHLLDSSTQSYNFFRNFISDLGRTNSLSGESNLISFTIFSVGTLLLLGSLTKFLYLGISQFKAHFGILTFLARISAIYSCFGVLGVIITPVNVPSLYALHIFFAVSMTMAIGITLGLYSFFFYKENYVDYSILILVSALSVVGYLVFIEYGPDARVSLIGLTLHASFQKYIVFMMVVTFFYMTKAIDLLNDEV
ncbi:MAG: hypothetical protein ACKVLG_02715 [Fidelibacterota bacterium]|tara:strand:- start:28 stop:693 length:666 start_codon:yes stop_codon:yes gene_type:complete